MADGVVALLWLGVPLIAWVLVVRTREVGLPVAVVLALGLGAGVILTATGALARGRVELGLGYAVAAGILVIVGLSSEEKRASSTAGSTFRAATHFFALTAVALQVAAAVLGALWIFLLAMEAERVSADEIPTMPAGFIAVGDDEEGCGSGSCSRSRMYVVAPDVSEAVVTALVRSSECRANGWLLDRRERCTGYRWSGDKLVVTVSLADRLQ